MSVYIYGTHAVEHALKNKNRTIHRIIEDKKLLNKLCGDVVHQGIMIETEVLEGELDYGKHILLLDQIQDMRNLGAIIRSAACFGVNNVMFETGRNCPNILQKDNYGMIAKAACGALEYVNLVKINNLSHTIRKLQDLGYWVIGLDEQGEKINVLQKFEKIVIVVGQEGRGLRALTKANCDLMCSIQTNEHFGCLNASVAASVAMFCLSNVA